ncbi:MAG: hypothetical protein JXL67_14125 [Calditrichaeota bacterium]|nr:hypothetical protein [Calditrichota bacterium]
MKKLILIIISVFYLIGTDALKAQYVRTEQFRNERERRQQYALDDWISYLPAKQIVRIAVGRNYIYFATLDGGILRYELFQNYWDYPFTTSNGLISNRVLDVAYDFSNSLLWAVTDLDTCVFKPAEQEWVCLSRSGVYWPYKFPEKKMPDTSGQIEHNIFYSGQFLDKLPHFFANGEWTMVESWKVMDENFDEYSITGFLRDDWERVWMIIEGLGVGIGNFYSQRIDVVPFGLTTIEPRIITYKENDLWIGGEPYEEGPGHPGIVNWRDHDGGWKYFQARWISNLPTDNVRDIEVTGDSVWFATDYGLILYNTRKNSWKNYDQRQGLFSRDVLDLISHDSKLYIGTDRGINIIDFNLDSLWRVKDDDIILATINRLAVQEDTIWAATNRGLFRSPPDTNDWQQVVPETAINELPALAIVSHKKEMWFTSSQGVFWMDSQTGQWHSFPQLGMNISGPFFDLKVNDISVWVSSPEGLLKYDRQRYYWKLFTTADGLLDNECHRLLLEGDYIWIANRSGITQFYWNNPNRID